jgi:hypothetical protein
MPANKVVTFGPIALSTAYNTDLIAPAAAGAGAVGYTPTADVVFIKKIRILNETATPRTARLFKGATGANVAGTRLIPEDTNVPANSYVDFYFQNLRLEGANGFIVGGASAAAALTLIADGEVGKA